MDAKIFCERLRRCRMSAGLQGKDLAVRAGISGPYLTQLEKGQRVPSHDLLIRLADALQVETNWLLNGEHADHVRLLPTKDTQDRKPGNTVREGLYCYPPDDWSKLVSENEELKRQLEEARVVIKNLSSALALGRAPDSDPAALASGAHYKTRPSKSA